MAGKGSKPRPFVVDRDTFENNWDAIFMKKQPVEISSYWSDCREYGSIVFREKNEYYVEIFQNGGLVATLRNNMYSQDQAEAIAENAVVEKRWVVDEYVEN